VLTPDDFLDSGGTMWSIGLIKSGDTDPRSYLRFAEEDLGELDCDRTRINALSNAKRALHLQIELLTNALGYDRWTDKAREGFPRRLRFAEKCGLVTPRILAKINRLRNEVEHDYLLPGRSTVEDYADVVALYLEASDRVVRGFPIHRQVDGRDGASYCLRTERESGVMKLYQADTKTLIGAMPEHDVPNPSTPPDKSPLGIEPIKVFSLSDDGDSYFKWIHFLLGIKKP
jgi:hypothetical protein